MLVSTHSFHKCPSKLLVLSEQQNYLTSYTNFKWQYILRIHLRLSSIIMFSNNFTTSRQLRFLIIQDVRNIRGNISCFVSYCLLNFVLAIWAVKSFLDLVLPYLWSCLRQDQERTKQDANNTTKSFIFVYVQQTNTRYK